MKRKFKKYTINDNKRNFKRDAVITENWKVAHSDTRIIPVPYINLKRNKNLLLLENYSPLLPVRIQ